MRNKIECRDVLEYEFLFTKTPALLLKTIIRTDTDLITKFKTAILTALEGLDEKQKTMLDIILNSEVEDLQKVLEEAYVKTGKKQFKILAQKSSEKFIKKNTDQLRKLVEQTGVK